METLWLFCPREAEHEVCVPVLPPEAVRALLGSPQECPWRGAGRDLKSRNWNSNPFGMGMYPEPTSLTACFFLCLPHTHKYSNRKIKLLISCLPIIATATVLLALAISKAPTTELTLVGERFFLILEFLHQNIIYIPRGWHRHQSLEFLTERRYFPHCFPSASIFLSTPFQSHLCQVSQEIPALVTLQPNPGESTH